MEFSSFTAGSDDAGRRLDRILKRILPDLTLSEMYQSLRKGMIKVNGKKADGSTKILCNDTITVAAFLLVKKDSDSPSLATTVHQIPSSSDKIQQSPRTTFHQSHGIPQLQTVFRNEYVWIINKPYGIPVQPDSTTKDGAPCLSDMVAVEFESSHQTSTSLSFRPGPLHRLDKNTTGLVAFSQNSEGARWFTAALAQESSDASDTANNMLRKTYIGIAQGQLNDSSLWNDPISGQPALTKATPLAHGVFMQKQVTLVQYDIFTGRKHQIRVHSALHGFPLLGDTLYGGTPIPPSFHAGRAFFLHAMHLFIAKDNPIGLPEELTAPIAEDFQKFLSSTLINWDGSLILI